MATIAKLLVALGLDSKDFHNGLDSAVKSTQSAGGAIGSALGLAAKASIVGLAAGAAGAVAGIFSGVASNAQFETFNTQFGVLLGSADAAQKRLDELSKFGATTPFELPELVSADKILVGFGLDSEDTAKKWHKSGAEIRTIVGDVASGTGAGFEEMSNLVGKFSAGATGEAISRFAELGITNRQQLSEMGLQFSKSGELLSPLPKAMDVVLGLMQKKYGGMMTAQSSTFEGMLSNLSDWKDQTLRKISAPIFELLKDKLGTLLAFLGSPEVMAAIDGFAQSVAQGIGGVIDWISNTGIPMFTAAWGTVWPIVSTVVAVFQELFAVFTGAGDIGSLFDTLADILPPDEAAAVANAVDVISTKLQEFIGWANDQIPKVLAFINQHWDAFKGALIAIGAVLAGAAIVGGIASIIGLIAALANPITAIIVIAGVLGAAWAEDWGGIREIVGGVWNFLEPIFTTVVAWLQKYIPVAIAATSQFFTDYLIPAFQTVAAFVNNPFLPALTMIVGYIINQLIPTIIKLAVDTFNNLKNGIAVVAGFWTGTLQPALNSVWQFINTYIVPIFSALINVWFALMKLELAALTLVWVAVLRPALESVWKLIQDYLIPFIDKLTGKSLGDLNKTSNEMAKLWNTVLWPALQKVGNWIDQNVTPIIKRLINDGLLKAKKAVDDFIGGLNGLYGVINSVIGWVNSLISVFDKVHTPDAIKQASPSEMEVALASISAAIEETVTHVKSLSKAFSKMGDDIAKKTKDLVGNIYNALAGIARGNYDISASLHDLTQIDPYQPLVDATKAYQDAQKDALAVQSQYLDITEEISQLEMHGGLLEHHDELVKLYAKQNDLLDQQALTQANLVELAKKQDAASSSGAIRQQAINAIVDETRKKYQELEEQALAMMNTDPKAALEFFNQRKAQIEELAQLEKQRALATTDEDKAFLDTQIRLLQAAQSAETQAQAAQIVINDNRTGKDKDILSIIQNALKDAGISVDIRYRTA